MENNIAISVKNLHKSFRLPTERAWGLKQAIFNRIKGIKGYKEQKVLNGISFTIHQGEFVGIVGRIDILPVDLRRLVITRLPKMNEVVIHIFIYRRTH